MYYVLVLQIYQNLITPWIFSKIRVCSLSGYLDAHLVEFDRGGELSPLKTFTDTSKIHKKSIKDMSMMANVLN